MPIVTFQSFDETKPAQGKGRSLSPQSSLWKRGPLVGVAINLPEPVFAKRVVEGKTFNSRVTGFAVIDTALKSTQVSESVVAGALGLIPVGVSTAEGTSPESGFGTFDCGFSFLEPETEIIQLRSITAVRMKDSALIARLGRDFLRDKILIYSGGNGMVTLAW